MRTAQCSSARDASHPRNGRTDREDCWQTATLINPMARFTIASASFPDYGKLSKINFAGNIAGASERIDTDKYDKEDARDFALWKEPATETEPAWDASIGRGRPGWHIECSAMSMKYLGETFDIHAGGSISFFLITRTRSRRAKAQPESSLSATGFTSNISKLKAKRCRSRRATTTRFAT